MRVESENGTKQDGAQYRSEFRMNFPPNILYEHGTKHEDILAIFQCSKVNVTIKR